MSRCPRSRPISASPGRSAMGHHRLHPLLRRLLLLGGRAGDLFGRQRLFFAGVALFSVASLAERAGAPRGRADRRPRAPGPRRRDALAGGALDHHDHLRRGRRAHQSARLERRRGRRRGGRPAARRPADRKLSWRWIFFVNVPIGIVDVLLRPEMVPNARRGASGTSTPRRDRGHCRWADAPSTRSSRRSLGLDRRQHARRLAWPRAFFAASR